MHVEIRLHANIKYVSSTTIDFSPKLTGASLTYTDELKQHWN